MKVKEFIKKHIKGESLTISDVIQIILIALPILAFLTYLIAYGIKIGNLIAYGIPMSYATLEFSDIMYVVPLLIFFTLAVSIESKRKEPKLNFEKNILKTLIKVLQIAIALTLLVGICIVLLVMFPNIVGSALLFGLIISLFWSIIKLFNVFEVLNIRLLVSFTLIYTFFVSVFIGTFDAIDKLEYEVLDNNYVIVGTYKDNYITQYYTVDKNNNVLIFGKEYKIIKIDNNDIKKVKFNRVEIVERAK